MWRLWISVALLLLIPALASARQAFETEPAYQEVNPGENVVLACRNSIKDGKPVGVGQDGKYEWHGSNDSGDCSIRIARADINYDDGDWRCQVTASSYDADDALSSRKARLVVRVPPSDPKILHDGVLLGPERGLRIKSGDSSSVQCESRGGNPAAVLKWYIDDVEIDGEQKNETAIADHKKWNAVSVVEARVKKEHNGKLLKCLAFHDAYPRKVREESTQLDVQYAPVVKLERNAEDLYDLEADKDSLRIKCRADANPAPKVVWRKAGSAESIFSLDEDLVFEPVRQGDGGTYFCMAQNAIGSSDQLSITFDVLHEPRNLRTKPGRFLDLEVGENARLECFADGEPEPEFEWLQRAEETAAGGRVKKTGAEITWRGGGSVIDLDNVTYDSEGIWVCAASNTIKGTTRRILTEPIRVDITGRPQALRYKTDQIQPFSRNSNAEAEIVFCSDPQPREVHWEWDDIKLSEGESQGRYYASKVRPDRRNDCYKAKLTISEVLPSDSRTYRLVARNDRGAMNFAIKVEVLDPIAMTTVVGVSAALLLLLVILVFALGYAYKGRKGCFKKKDSPESSRRILRGSSRAPSTASFYPPSTTTRLPPTEASHYAPSTTVPPYSPPHSYPGELQRREQVMCTPPLTTPTGGGGGAYSRRSTLLQPAENTQQQQQHQSGLPPVKPRFKHEPTYPLPPASQFPLMGRRRTPQNAPPPPQSAEDTPSTPPSSSPSPPEPELTERPASRPLPPNLLYADLQFPKSVNSGSMMALNNNKGGRISSSVAEEAHMAANGNGHYGRARDRADI